MLLLTLFLVSSLTVMAGATLAPALPDLAAHFDPGGDRAVWVRLVLTLPALATALAAGPAGWMLDRYGRKGPLVAFTALYAASGSAGLYLDSLGSILASRALLGVSVAGAMTAATVLIADFFQGEERQKVMGQQAAFMGLGGVVFLSLGGALGELGWRGPFAVYLGAIPILGLVLLRIPRGRQEQEADLPRLGFADLDPRERVRLVQLCGIALLGMLFFYVIPVQAPFRLQQFEGASASVTGFSLAGMTLCGALGSTVFRLLHARSGTSWIYALFFGALSVGFAGLWRAGNLGQAVASMTAIGFGTGMLMPNTNVRATRHIPEALRGRAVGAVTVSFFLGQFLSPVASEPLVARFGQAGMFGVLAAVLVLLSAVFVVHALRRRVGSGGAA